MRLCVRIAFSLLLSIPLLTSTLFSQTRQYLDAPVVTSRIRVQLSGKDIQWELDNDDTFRGFPAHGLFLTKSSVYVTYPQLNPLRVQATASAVAADDPTFAAIKKLMDGITSVATTAGPAAVTGTGAAAAPVVSACHAAVDSLNNALYGDSTSATAIQAKLKGWIYEIDKSLQTKTGPESIQDAITLMRNDANGSTGPTVIIGIKNNVDNAKKQWDLIKGCGTNPATPAADALYIATNAGDPHLRIEQLTALIAAINELANLLDKQFADTAKWTGPKTTDYKISAEITPTFDKMQTVTVKITTITLKVDTNTEALLTDQQAASSVAFDVRKYGIFTPEIGAGAVFGTIAVPQYGTGTNSSGQTVVARVSTSSVSVNPTVLANFVCRCGTGLLVPMLQVGAAASKTLPAILLGGGLRLFGLSKGDVAIGGGGMFGWYKDLNKLHVGDVVTGTQAIQSDLTFTSAPKVGGYVAIQYKF